MHQVSGAPFATKLLEGSEEEVAFKGFERVSVKAAVIWPFKVSLDPLGSEFLGLLYKWRPCLILYLN